MRRIAVAVLACLVLPASAQAAKSSFVIKGAGFGHGIGLSQYGADGYALHGFGYQTIVGHYYQGTSIATVSPAPTVRVLLQSSSAPSFTGASDASGRTLDPAKTYSIVRAGGNSVALRSPKGRRLATYDGTLRVTGDAPLRLNGLAGNGVRSGRYRGALEFRAGLFSGVSAINAVGLEDYVRGVVSAESPAAWPAAALEAQAVVARSYAVTTDAGSASDGFTAYADTRSQMYRGVAAEYTSTESAVKATKGEVVTYGGKPVVTYFFSTSGGRTENVENSFIGSPAQPWLRSVEDPYDDVSPKHRWGPIRLTFKTAAAKLRGLVAGRFRGIEVLTRGTSPRVVEADIVGTRGTTRVSGATLRARFGLFDTWAYFASIGTRPAPPPDSDPATGGTEPDPTARAARRPAFASLVGTVRPATRYATVSVQRRTAAGWRSAGWGRTEPGGRYRVPVATAGVYRVVYRGVAGAPVRVQSR